MSEQNAQAVATETKPAVPVLTLTPEMGDKQVIESAMEMLNELKAPAAPESADEAVEKLADGLTEAEKAQVAAFAKTIDVTNPDHVMLYGAEAQKKISTFADTVLGNVQTADTGDVGDILANLITELKGFNTAGDKPKGIRGWFFTARKRIAAIQAKYEDVSVNVEAISKNLEDHQVQLLKDVAMFNHLYEQNLEYFHELTLYIVAGEERLAEVRATTLQQLRDKAEQTGDAMDAQAAKDLADQCDRFEKKLHDLQLTRTVAMQTGPQIRMIQSSDSVMAEKIQSTIVNTIPLWKSQMVIAIGVEHANKAARAQREVTEMTNQLLKKNADALKTATIETAKESERGIVDIETLKHTNEMLISTMDEVLTIQSEGKQKRIEAEAELAGIESQLREKLLQASRS